MTRHAEADLGEILDFITVREGPIRAAGVADKLEAGLEALGRSPRKGAIPHELGDLGLTGFHQAHVGPSRVIYRVEDLRVIVLLVADGRRDFRGLLERRLLSAP